MLRRGDPLFRNPLLTGKKKPLSPLGAKEGMDDMAEAQGFEPWLALRLLTVFETVPFNRLGKPPARDMITKKPSFLN